MRTETQESKPIPLIYPIVMMVTILLGCWWLLEDNRPQATTETHETASP